MDRGRTDEAEWIHARPRQSVSRKHGSHLGSLGSLGSVGGGGREFCSSCTVFNKRRSQRTAGEYDDGDGRWQLAVSAGSGFCRRACSGASGGGDDGVRDWVHPSSAAGHAEGHLVPGPCSPAARDVCDVCARVLGWTWAWANTSICDGLARRRSDAPQAPPAE